ncbi:kinase-like protein [Ceratobasidium sp. AG-I]|nr:kinase-like protein [Ceratobasidium sp. AG-I]
MARLALSELQRFNRGQTAEPWQAFLQQYRMQASLWSKLHHDNVVKILALGRGLDLQVEYCENRSVREICDTLSGLEYLHAQGPAIVHGNLNAGKIFVDASGITKIGEFGLTALCSKFAGSLPDVSMEGLSRWMSPELLDPHQEDVAGTIVAEKLPYAKCRHEMKIQKEILAGKLPGNYESILDSPSMRALWSLLEGCWTEQPEGRPSVSSLLVQFNTITANESANGSEGSISWKQMTWTESVLNIADKPTTSVSYPDYDTPIASKQDLSLNASDVNDEVANYY